MSKKKAQADRAWWYFHAGFDQDNQEIYNAVKGRMAARLGAEPTNLTIMVELMKFYLENNEE